MPASGGPVATTYPVVNLKTVRRELLQTVNDYLREHTRQRVEPL
jgi:hypothetical protein